MLASLVVNLLIVCSMILLAGWTSDQIGKWSAANTGVVCCTATTPIALGKRIDHVERFLLSDSHPAGYTQSGEKIGSHRHSRHYI